MRESSPTSDIQLASIREAKIPQGVAEERLRPSFLASRVSIFSGFATTGANRRTSGVRPFRLMPRWTE